MKKAGILSVIILLVFATSSCIIQNPKPDNCEVKEIVVSKIYEGGVKDIVFAESNGDFYYINRGLEQGLTIEEMETKVLNKTVTLHLANTMVGTSNHIAQLALTDEVVFTEFN